jgi:hypothetical protein
MAKRAQMLNTLSEGEKLLARERRLEGRKWLGEGAKRQKEGALR